PNYTAMPLPQPNCFSMSIYQHFMKPFKLPANIVISLLIGAAILLFASFSDISFPLLSLDRTKVGSGELWRIFTGNFVHFGWAHSLMNLAGFLIVGLILLNAVSMRQFICLLLLCCLGVGTGIYYFNPEYGVYAGFSGAIHGLIVAALLLNKRHSHWLNGIFIALVFGKIFYEHQSDYQATDLQNLLPVPVAYDAHLYGAIVGLVFGISALATDQFIKYKHSH
ncbi:MAG: rhombosortase, partial [Cellvibrio sp.]